MEEKYYQQATKEVRRKKRFYRHFVAFMIINLFLFFINQMTDPFQWFIFPLLSWGVALSFHYINVFGLPGNKALSKEWEKREIEKEMHRLRNEDNYKYNRPVDHNITLPDEELELNDFKKLRKDWDDSELV